MTQETQTPETVQEEPQSGALDQVAAIIARQGGADSPLAAALRRAGVQLDQVAVPEAVGFMPTSLEELCEEQTDRLGRQFRSPIMFVVGVEEHPEAERFPGYVGRIDVQAVTENGEEVAWSHYLAKDSGELSPIAAFLRSAEGQTVAMRVGMSKNSQGQTRYRPIAL